jgi:hypothetical protein
MPPAQGAAYRGRSLQPTGPPRTPPPDLEPMIDTAIAQLAGQLNQALKRQFTVGEDLVVLSHLHEQDGSVAPQAVSKVVAFLVNIEREAVPGASGGSAGLLRQAQKAPPVHLNLMLMFAANFGGATYPEALKFLAATVQFFQGRPVFNHQNTPELDPRIDKLTLEIENLSISDLSNLWGVLGGTYLPSVLYRVRMVSLEAGQLQAQLPRVTQPVVGVQ